MSTEFHGLQVRFDHITNGETWSRINDVLIDAVSLVWEHVQLPSTSMAYHRQQTGQFLIAHEQMIRQLQEPLTEDGQLDLEAIERMREKVPAPEVDFSPFSCDGLRDYPNGWVAFRYRDGTGWRQEATVAASYSFENSGRYFGWPFERLTAMGTWGIPVPEFDRKAMLFTSDAQNDIYEWLVAEFDKQCRLDDGSEYWEYWLFNRSALAYVCSAVWSAHQVIEYQLICPQRD